MLDSLPVEFVLRFARVVAGSAGYGERSVLFFFAVVEAHSSSGYGREVEKQKSRVHIFLSTRTSLEVLYEVAPLP